VEFDACIWSGGFVALDLAREAGLSVDVRGQVLTDAQLRSCSHPHVYAIGDAALPCEPVGDPLPMGCKSAIPMGLHAAENLVHELRGEQVAPLQFASPLFCVSLGRKEGLIQQRSADKHLRGRILRGVPAVLVKELICQGTLWFLRLEGARARFAQRLRWGVRPHELVAEVDSAR
jgi:NADH dehydrogenase FAD-containing subunit